MKYLKLWFVLLISILLVACGNDGVVPAHPEGTPQIAGTVKNGSTGVNRVVMSITGTSTSTVFTNTSGKYGANGLPTGGYEVRPTLPGYAFTPNSVFLDVAPNKQVSADFTAAQVKYSVAGSIGGDIRLGVTLTIYNTDGISQGTVTSDVNGKFAFPSIPLGTYTVTPSLSGYVFTNTSATITVNGSNLTGINFTAAVSSGSSTGISNIVSGGITGSSYNSVAISIYNSNGVLIDATSSDVNGRYSYTITTNGSFTIVPSKNGYTFTPTSTVVSVNNNNQLGVNFTSVAGAASTFSLAGSISGDVNKGITLSLYDANGVFIKSTITDQNGFYSYTGLSNGTYNVIPSLAGYSFAPTTRTEIISGANINYSNYVSSKVLRTISGRISGAPYTRFDLTGPSTASATLADASGYYSFDVYLPGTYTLVPTRKGYGFTAPFAILNYSGTSIANVDFIGIFTPSISNNEVHGSTTYNCTGATITVPANVNTVLFEATGGSGGSGGAGGSGGGGGGAIVYNYTTNQLLFFIGGGGGGASGLPGPGGGGAGGTFSAFASGGGTPGNGGAQGGTAGATFLGGKGGNGCFCDGRNQFGGYGGGGGIGEGRGGSGGTWVGTGTSCLFGSFSQSQGCQGEGGAFTSLTVNTGRGGHGGWSGYSGGGGGGGGYGSGGGGAGAGGNGNGSEVGGGGGGGGNFVLPGAIMSGNSAMFNIDMGNHVLGVMGATGGSSPSSNGQCGQVTVSW